MSTHNLPLGNGIAHQVDSDRGWGITVRQASEYWADQWPHVIGEKYGDLVRVDAYGDDASMELTPAEARGLAAALLAMADRTEGAPSAGSRVPLEHVITEETATGRVIVARFAYVGDASTACTALQSAGSAAGRYAIEKDG